ncbi:hypothetical protein QE109_12725 [Fusibacter bizertensis]|uniref:GGDEF domain-containing protein n=1 Tax=Fusibacter bizertensis TaxID=1488331 RepID=A0ABT6NF51_9FIRM|nr:hypothetical protein [Fusibacter bizertensis]MDH8679017.1 hypothetical protein [Fusibacter bizertensis]
MKVIIISNEPILVAYVSKKIKRVTSNFMEIITINHEVGHDESFFENSVVVFILNRISYLEKMPYYYEVFSPVVLSNLQVFVLHSEGIRNMTYDIYPLNEAKLYELTLEYNLFIQEIGSKILKLTSSNKKKRNLRFELINFEDLVYREMALSKRLGLNFSISYMKPKWNRSIDLSKLENNNEFINLNMREIDSIFITAQHEIILLLPATNYEGALVASQKISKEILMQIRAYESNCSDNFSIEIISYPKDVVSYEHMLSELREIISSCTASTNIKSHHELSQNRYQFNNTEKHIDKYI